MKIYVSPSTQEKNVNRAVGYVEETQMNLIADVLIPELINRGFEIKRNNKDAPGVNVIVAESNAWGADYHIAIHSNATGLFQSKRRGCEVYCDNPIDLSDKGTQIAHTIYNAVAAIAPVPGRGVLSGHTTMSEVRYTNAHSALIEIDYHDTNDGALWIMNNIKKLAYAILEGIVRHIEGDDMIICKKGDKDSVTGGKTVFAMQTGLVTLGYKMINNGIEYPPDGNYGTASSNGVASFQKANGLVVNGDVFDDKTNAVMLLKLSAIKTELDAANAKIASLENQIKALNVQITNLKTQITNLNAQIVNLNAQLQAEINKNTELSAKLAESQSQVSSLTTQLAVVTADRNAKLADLTEIAKAQDIISKY